MNRYEYRLFLLPSGCSVEELAKVTDEVNRLGSEGYAIDRIVGEVIILRKTIIPE